MAKKTKPTPPKAPYDTVGVDAPVLEIEGMPSISRFELRLNGRQARAMRAVFDGLQCAGETVALTHSVGPVKRVPDAVRWLLDRVADAADID